MGDPIHFEAKGFQEKGQEMRNRPSAAMSNGERRNLKRMVVMGTPRGLSVLPQGQQVSGSDIVLPRIKMSPLMSTKGIRGGLRKPRLF